MKKEKKQVVELDLKDKELQLARDAKLNLIGNIVHDSVVVSKDEANNAIIRTFGEKIIKPRKHYELLYMIDGADLERGIEVAGHRGYFLKGVGVQISLAIINCGINFLIERGFTVLQTPLFMKKEAMSKAVQLSQFNEELYKVVGGEEDAYLIATSEQPIAAYHQKEWIETKQLPIKYAGYSTCFRKEAGAHGKDVRGIFRVHQFEKIEQFVITTPENSWDMHEQMIKTAEEFWQMLGIPYRVVNIVSGELNNAAAKKYDLEGWFPGFQEYRELVSCSNCTDYQSRNLEIRCGTKKQGEDKKYVHMLNSTLCALTRAICVVLENYQTDKGIEVPKALRPYIGKDFIPFVHDSYPEPKETKEKEKTPAKK